MLRSGDIQRTSIHGHTTRRKKWRSKNRAPWKSRKSTLKSQFSKWRFEWLGVLRSTSQLQVDLKIFSDVEIFFYKLLRHCAGPGECSAHRFMVIRHEEKKWRGKNRAPWKNTKNFKHVKVLTCASLSSLPFSKKYRYLFENRAEKKSTGRGLANWKVSKMKIVSE